MLKAVWKSLKDGVRNDRHMVMRMRGLQGRWEDTRAQQREWGEERRWGLSYAEVIVLRSDTAVVVALDLVQERLRLEEKGDGEEERDERRV